MTPFVKVLVRWAKGNRLTNRLPNLSLIALLSGSQHIPLYYKVKNYNHLVLIVDRVSTLCGVVCHHGKTFSFLG